MIKPNVFPLAGVSWHRVSDADIDNGDVTYKGVDGGNNGDVCVCGEEERVIMSMIEQV